MRPDAHRLREGRRSDPQQAGQARAVAQMYKEFAAIGGIAYETQLNVKMDMGGGGSPNPLGGFLSKLGNISMSTLVESVETGPVAADLFAPPAGYKLNPRK